MSRHSPVPETEILIPLDPAISNENDWPDFLLTAAEVSDPDSGQFESLLHAGPKRPLTLVGKLSRSKDQQKYLRGDSPARAPPLIISVPEVEHFCYGQDNDGQAILWAAGNAGWFQIQPSRAYKPLHKYSCEGIIALYFLADLYGELKGNKLKSTPVTTIFKQYAEDDSHKCFGELEAKQVFLRHSPFLLDCMHKGKEGINWKNTSIFEFLMQEEDDEASTSAPEDESNAHTPQPMDTSDDEPSRRRSGKSKSSLRPRSGKYSLKAIGRRRDIDGVGPPLASIESIESIQSPLKRKTTGPPSNRPRKRAAVPSDSDSESSDDKASDTKLPLGTTPKAATTASGRAPRIKIVEETLPSFQPQGPGDSWVCTFDGCSYLVYDAKKPENQELIREHHKQHAIDSQARIDLIYQEERSWLPVNNLIKKIRDLAAQGKTSDTGDQNGALAANAGSEPQFPKPIRRKWL